MGDKSGRLGPLLADANRIGLRSDALIAYLNIITTRGEPKPGIIAQCDVK